MCVQTYQHDHFLEFDRYIRAVINLKDAQTLPNSLLVLSFLDSEDASSANSMATSYAIVGASRGIGLEFVRQLVSPSCLPCSCAGLHSVNESLQGGTSEHGSLCNRSIRTYINPPGHRHRQGQERPRLGCRRYRPWIPGSELLLPHVVRNNSLLITRCSVLRKESER